MNGELDVARYRLRRAIDEATATGSMIVRLTVADAELIEDTLATPEPTLDADEDDEMATVRQQERDLDRALFKARITGDEARLWAAVRLALEQLHQRGPGDQEDDPADGRCTSCLVVWPCPTGAVLYDPRGGGRR